MLDVRRLREYHALKAALVARPLAARDRRSAAVEDVFSPDETAEVAQDGPIIQPRDDARTDAQFYEPWRRRRA